MWNSEKMIDAVIAIVFTIGAVMFVAHFTGN